MRRIRLGRTGEKVSAVAFGTWSHGGAKTVAGRPVGWSGHDDGLARAALERAWELGIDHWDTADVYGDGHAEELIGSLWKRVPRDQIFLATKVGWAPGPEGNHYHPRQIRERLERSLRLLATDRVDLHYFHRCDFGPRDRFLDDAVETMRALRSEGKFRFLGLSDWDANKLARYARRIEPDVVQPYRNVVDDAYRPSGLEEWVTSHDAGAAFFSPLKHGLLLGKYERPPSFERGDIRSGIPAFRNRSVLTHLRRCRDEIRRLFPESPQPVLHALVGVLLHDAPSACVLLGIRNPDQAEAAAAVGEPLTAEQAQEVRSLYREPRIWEALAKD